MIETSILAMAIFASIGTISTIKDDPYKHHIALAAIASLMWAIYITQF